MRLASIFISLISLFFLFSSCSIWNKAPKIDAEIGFVFLQDDEWTELSENEMELTVRKKAFDFQFLVEQYNADTKHFHAIQLAASKDKDSQYKANIGMNVNEVDFFSPGTGLSAGREEGYQHLFLNNDGHHYLFYESENNKRVNLVGKHDNLLRVNFGVNSFYIDGRTELIKDTEIDKIYLTILYDRNKNQIIEKNELRKVTLKFID